MELGRKFHAGEVHLLVSPEQETGDWWSHTVRRLTKDHIPTAVMTLQQAFVVPFRTERIPVHVIYSAGMKDTSALRQVHGPRPFAPELLLVGGGGARNERNFWEKILF